MITLIGSLISDGINYFREKRQAKHELKMSVIRNKQRLAEDEQTNNHDWEMATLENRDRFLRILSFCMFGLPLVITVVSPDTGSQIFNNLEQAPDWYVQTFIAINGGVWGIVELKNAAPQFINAIRQVLKQ